jgi:hypothetical protein
MIGDLMTDLRKLNDERDKRIREAADPDCHICKGRGKTRGHIAADKYASYPCRCTGIPEAA